MYGIHNIIEKFWKTPTSVINDQTLTLIECSNKLIRKYVPEKYLDQVSKRLSDSNMYYIEEVGYKYYITISIIFLNHVTKLYYIYIIKQNGHCTGPLDQAETCKFIVNHFQEIKKYLLSCVNDLQQEELHRVNLRHEKQNCLQKLDNLIKGDLHESNK